LIKRTANQGKPLKASWFLGAKRATDAKEANQIEPGRGETHWVLGDPGVSL